jgi:ribosomal protein S18 acetylase RimI-like enzyme
MIIREAQPKDDSQIALIRGSATATLRAVYHPNEQALARKVAESKSLTRLVAEVEGRLVGTLEYGEGQDLIKFLGLGVLSQCRRKGVARALIEELNRRAARKKLSKLSLWCVKETGNVEIFRKLGFEVVAEEPSTYFTSDSFPCLTEVLMERAVTKM